MTNHRPALARRTAGRTARPTASQVLCLSALALTTSAASAQFTVVNLHPTGASESSAWGGSGGQQVGNSVVGARRIASIWNGTAGSHAELSGPGFTNSAAYGAQGGHQVGYVGNSFSYRAALWSGDAGSFIDLHAGGSSSVAFAVHGNQQVGVVLSGTTERASIWTGSAASWQSVHPAAFASSSSLSGTSGDQQVGQVRLLDTGAIHASLWTGNAASWVDLNPDEASESQCYGVGSGQQVGLARVDGDPGRDLHAALWSGTADSWIDLQPDLGDAGGNSEAYGAFGGQQVGMVNVNFFSHASLWSGTADSWVDLHTFLPAEFLTSTARSIWRDGGFTYIAGSGYNTLTNHEEALLWAQPVPAPTAMALLSMGGLLATRRRRA